MNSYIIVSLKVNDIFYCNYQTFKQHLKKKCRGTNVISIIVTCPETTSILVRTKLTQLKGVMNYVTGPTDVLSLHGMINHLEAVNDTKIVV